MELVLAAHGLIEVDFLHGVAAGEPWPSSIVLWSRVTPRAAHGQPLPSNHTVRVHWAVAATDDEAVAAKNAALYDELTAASILAPLRGRIEGGRAADGGGTNYVAPAGLSSIVAHLFASVGVEPVRTRRAVRLATTTSPAAWAVHTADGHTQRFDGVVLTQPLPEMLELIDSGDAGGWLADGAEEDRRGVARAASASPT